MSATILNLYRLLDDFETMFFPMADDKRLKLVFERSSEVPQYVRVDEVRLRLVLTNLLSIALESTSQGSVLLRTDTIAHSPQGPADLRLSFAIEDTGPGMAAQDVLELSDSAIPAWAGRRVPENSDLALAISNRYVQLLRGTLNIESQVGHGTTVAFDIPVELIGPDRDVARAGQKSRPVLALAHGQPHWRVLVADERRAARLFLVRLLAPVGFEVREASNGREVFDLWQAWQPHLILMDRGMLVMDGREAAQRIKANLEGLAPIIIALTASSFKQPRRALLQAGCDDFLSMPFQDTDLYEMLRKYLGVQYVYTDDPAGEAHSAAGGGEVSPADTMAQASGRIQSGKSGPKGTLLIVDDSPALLESLATLLTDQGYTVVHAFLDGKLALKFVESTLPDLVLLDILMPGMDGFQVCRHLKARVRTRDIPIIFLTVMTETLDKVQGFRLGAVDYIARPFEAEEVLARVTTHLTLHRQQKQLEAKHIQLQESEELHRLTLSSISDAVFLTDDSGAFKFICPNVNTIFGYSIQEVQALSNISKLLGGDLFDPAELETMREIQNVERNVTDRVSMIDLTRFDQFRSHPWHGLSPGSDPPHIVQAYIEITPFDPVKYEIDKVTGYLRVDRPQRSSSQPPALYGFIPRTYCGPLVAALSPEVTQADGDPLDICVLSERLINRSEVLLDAVVVGGLRAIDGGMADDKIIAVLYNDNIWGAADDITDIPQRLVERLEHYFSTYKMVPGHPSTMVIRGIYGMAHAQQVVRAAMDDYIARFGQSDRKDQ